MENIQKINKPKVSVIIPSWNRGYIIEKTIKSVLNQTMSDLEVLVCDDGSTDDSYEKVSHMRDPRVRWIVGTRGGRPAIPRNNGIREAKGEWLAFLDSDDEWFPEKLGKQLALAEKNGTKAVSSNASRLIPNKGIVGEYLSLNKDRITFDDLLKINEIITSSVLVHASLIESVDGFPESEDLKTIEDYAMWLRIATKTDFAYCCEALVVYRDDAENSVRGEKNIDTYEQKKQVFKDFMRWAERGGEKGNFLKKVENAYEMSVVDKHTPLLLNELDETKKQLQQIQRSYSFKIGYVLLHPFSFSSFLEKNNKKKEKNPKITVLMPAYNAQKYLRKAIDSILNQTLKDFEFLIINDGSVDNTEKIILSYKDERIVYIKNEKNLGVIDTLNRGLNLAKGKYIARMDADDVALPKRLEKQFEYMEKNEEVGVCGTWVRLTGNAFPVVIKNPVEHEDIVCRLLFVNSIAHPTVMIRKGVLIENNLKYAQYKSAEDFELWSRCSKVCKLHNIPEVLLKYRITPSSVTQTTRGDVPTTVERIFLEKLKELDPEMGEKEAILNRLIGNKHSFSNISEIQEVKNHLKRLFEANNKKNIYPQTAFLETLHFHWMSSCARYTGKYAEVAKIYSIGDPFLQNNPKWPFEICKMVLLKIVLDLKNSVCWLLSFSRNALVRLKILNNQ